MYQLKHTGWDKCGPSDKDFLDEKAYLVTTEPRKLIVMV
jgi:hypothetical protein